ncbi:MAG TPA: hypothetical protein VIY69_13100 [Candidatus Acidoferrales bacterium]
MLWHKAWRESRIRFLLIALFILSYCVYAVLTQETSRASFSPRGALVMVNLSYPAYVYMSIYGKAAFAFLLFCPALLSMGGLLRERGYGTAILSLCLPVSRHKLTAVRAAVGLLEVASLAFIPAVVIAALSPMVGESYPISVALHFALLWAVCGSAFFATSFLFSVAIGGTYSALVVSFISVYLYAFVTSLRPTRFGLSEIIGGINKPIRDRLFTGLPDPLPWGTLLIVAAVSFALLVTAARITERQDF